MTIINGRQIAPTVDGIREDHVARYRWAVGWDGVRGGKVIDLGCGCGYGAAILASVAEKVTAVDADKEAIDYAKAHYDAEAITWRVGRAETARLPKADAVVAFEVIEHVDDAVGLLKRLATAAPILIGSVPNEAVIPFSKARNPYHVRHFTPSELQAALHDAGWTGVTIHSQAGKRGADAAIRDNDKGWTLVFLATR